MSRVAFLFSFLSLFGPALVGSGLLSQTQAKECCELPSSCDRLARSTSEGAELLDALALNASADSYTRLGQWYLGAGEVECATWAFQTALNKDAQSWEAHYGLGLALVQKGDGKKALEELRLVVQRRPEDVMAHNALGLAFEALGAYDSAAEEFKRALALDPKL